MAAQGKWTLEQIAVAVDAGRSTVAGWLKMLRERGFQALVSRQPGQSAPGALGADLQQEISAGLTQGRWWRGVELQRWLKAEHGIDLQMGGVYYYLGKAGGVLKVPRKTYAERDPVQAATFTEELGAKLAELPLDSNRPVRVWMADEHRFGLISVVRRCWSLRGVRPYAPYHTKYQWGYLYSALEVGGAYGSQALFTSSVNLPTSGKFLEQLVASHAASQRVVIWDHGAEVAAVGRARPKAALLPGAPPGRSHESRHPGGDRTVRPRAAAPPPGAGCRRCVRSPRKARGPSHRVVRCLWRGDVAPSLARRRRRYAPRRACGRVFAPGVLPPIV